MKIIIIGAGLSGLSTAIALRKYVHTTTGVEIKIYGKPDEEPFNPNETPSDPGNRHRNLGAGLGLQSNGLRVLADLDSKLRDKVHASGFPCTHFKWKTAGDVLIAREYVDVLPISRPLLIDCLMGSLPAGVVEYKTVKEVVVQEGERPVVRFVNGEEESADLIVGADGIRSVVRQGIFGDDERYRPEYLGVCGVGGVLNIPLPQHLLDDPSMIFFMGSTGVFGFTGLTQADKNKLLFWSIYETDVPERGMKLDRDLLLKQLRERHSGWTAPLIDICLAKAELDNIYPVFVMPELPHWGTHGCVLIGDAAHALPPRSGQGSSQAFEAGQTLALLLAANLKEHDVGEAVEKSITALYNVRHARVHSIRSKAMAWKDPKMPMPWWKMYLLYTFLFFL